MVWWILAATAISGAPAPTYLACELSQEGGKLSVDVAVDEPNQQVTIALPTGRTVTRRALFSPSEVRALDDQQTWLINRVDLSFGRTFAFMPEGDPGESGVCRVKVAPAKRAF